MAGTMSSETSTFRYSRIEPEHQPKLMDTIEEILREGNSHNAGKYDDNHWRWQYVKLPSARSFVYGAFDANNALIGYYHIPCYNGKADNNPVLIGMVQDVAISRRFRGGGVFRELAQYAHREVAKEVDFIYTFPNQKSIHTFIKYNQYTLVQTLPAYVLPVKAAMIVRSKLKIPLVSHLAIPVDFFYQKIFRISIHGSYRFAFDSTLDAETESLFTSFNALHKIAILRNNQYVQWRFLEKPNCKHYVLKVRYNEKLVALLIFKPDEMLGNPALLLMDYAHCDNEKHLLIALQWLRETGLHQISEPVSMIFTTGNDSFFSTLHKIGFIRIPQKFNPRPLNLLVKNVRIVDHSSGLFNRQHWLVTLADWDVF